MLQYTVKYDGSKKGYIFVTTVRLNGGGQFTRKMFMCKAHRSPCFQSMGKFVL
jgi:hypothetical protein